MDKVIDLISNASEFPIEFVLALIALSAIGLSANMMLMVSRSAVIEQLLKNKPKSFAEFFAIMRVAARQGRLQEN